MKNTSHSDAVAESTKNLRSQVSEMRGRIGEFVSNTAESARDHVQDAYDGARKSFVRGTKTTRATVRRHPLEAVLIAAGAGLLVGVFSTLLCGRRGR
jgi:ElaB/YqjD/DUF883 family membrane-anchored ribosome-binding protein